MNLFFYGSFCDSWRSRFLLGRKTWHSHYRSYLVGWRFNFTTINFYYQLKQFQQSLILLQTTFARGGLVWVFGLSNVTNYFRWGQAYNKWVPGQFSNHWMNIERNLYLRRYRSGLTGENGRYTRTIKTFSSRLSRLRSSLQIRQVINFERSLSFNLLSFKSSYLRKRKTSFSFLNVFRQKSQKELLVLENQFSKFNKLRRRSYLKKNSTKLSTFSLIENKLDKSVQLTSLFFKKQTTGINFEVQLVCLKVLTELFFDFQLSSITKLNLFEQTYTKLEKTYFYRWRFALEEEKTSLFFSFYQSFTTLLCFDWKLFQKLTLDYQIKKVIYNYQTKIENNEQLNQDNFLAEDDSRELTELSLKNVTTKDDLYIYQEDEKFFDGTFFIQPTTARRLNKKRIPALSSNFNLKLYPLYLQLYQTSHLFNLQTTKEGKKEESLPSTVKSRVSSKFNQARLKRYRLSQELLKFKAYPRILNSTTDWGYNSIKKATYASPIMEPGMGYRRSQQLKWLNRLNFSLTSQITNKSLTSNLFLKPVLLSRLNFYLKINKGIKAQLNLSHRGIENSFFLPSLVVAGSLKQKLYSLVSEIENYQFPFIYLYTNQTYPNTAAYGLLWNNNQSSTRVWYLLIETTWKYSCFGGLLQVFSRRVFG